MKQQHRKKRWQDQLRPAMIERAFTPRIAQDLETFDVQVDEADRDALLAGWGLFLYGAVGSGKTLYASAAMLSAARYRYVVAQQLPPSLQLVTAPRLLRSLRESFDSGRSEGEVIDRYTHGIDLLAIDDLGTEKLTDWTSQVFQEIINERYERHLPLIVTTNANGLRGLVEFLGGTRIPSRLMAVCRQRHLGDRDRRPVVGGG